MNYRIRLPFSRTRQHDFAQVDERTDFAALARELAAAEQEVWPSTDPRWDPDPEPLLQAYRELRGGELGFRLARAVAGLLQDEDEGVRQVARRFVEEFPPGPQA